MPLTIDQLRAKDEYDINGIRKMNFTSVLGVDSITASALISMWESVHRRKLQLSSEQRLELETAYNLNRKTLFDAIRYIDMDRDLDKCARSKRKEGAKIEYWSFLLRGLE